MSNEPKAVKRQGNCSDWPREKRSIGFNKRMGCDWHLRIVQAPEYVDSQNRNEEESRKLELRANSDDFTVENSILRHSMVHSKEAVYDPRSWNPAVAPAKTGPVVD